MDAKCEITTCEVLDIGVSIFNLLAYGVDCDPIKYCYFSDYYIHHELDRDNNGKYDNNDSKDNDDNGDWDDDTDNDDGNEEDDNNIIVGTISYSAEFTDYVCVIIDDNATTTTTTTTTTSTTTSTTTTIYVECFLDFTLDGEVVITTTTTTTTTTSSTTTTTTTIPISEICDVQGDITEIVW